MRALSRLAAVVLVLCYGGAWASPCPQLDRPIGNRHAERDPARATEAAAAASHVHTMAEHAPAPVEPGPALHAPCPCGCDEQPLTPGDAGGSPLGFALRTRAAELPPLPGSPRLAGDPARTPLAPQRPLDHVPLPA